MKRWPLSQDLIKNRKLILGKAKEGVFQAEGRPSVEVLRRKQTAIARAAGSP